MIDWLARANSVISQTSPTPTDRTDETPVLSVSSAPPGFIREKRIAISSVSSVGVAPICEKPKPPALRHDDGRSRLRSKSARVGAELDGGAHEVVREAFDERAGIREYDGGRNRQEAEQGAAADLGIRRACLTCLHRSARRTCLRPVEAGLTAGFEIVWCELLPETNCSAFEVRIQTGINRCMEVAQ